MLFEQHFVKFSHKPRELVGGEQNWSTTDRKGRVKLVHLGNPLYIGSNYLLPSYGGIRRCLRWKIMKRFALQFFARV